MVAALVNGVRPLWIGRANVHKHIVVDFSPVLLLPGSSDEFSQGCKFLVTARSLQVVVA
jgi:hypothetical protein